MTDSTRPTVFCKDCKFAKRWGGLSRYSPCLHPNAIEFDSGYLTLGKIEQKSLARMRSEYNGACGPEAKLWEPRR